jgi:3',5'-cyclic AMP phosphodiesterase CpdA
LDPSRQKGIGATSAGFTAAVAVALGVVTGTSYAHPGHADVDPLLGDSTLEHTIRGEDQEHVNDTRGDPDSFALLRLGPGEPYVVRDELAEPRGNRGNRRTSLIYVGHLTDMQLADQQSPGRAEFLDRLGGAVRSAWRPQETLVPHQTELSIRQMNRFVDSSPVPQGDGSRAEMDNAVLTGDLADNQQLNETRWVAELLQGGVFVDGTRVGNQVDPNSGSSEVSEYPEECQAAVAAGLLNPDDADRYVGVQSYDDYPGGSTLADRHNFYDPDQPQGPHFGNWPRYEGLMDKAQEPFVAEGLRVPSYVAFGNHDGLAQGNQWTNAVIDEIARGCVKVFPAPGAEGFFEDLLGQPATLSHRRLMREALGIAGQPTTQQVQRQQARVLEGFEQFVPPDDDRRFIDRREFMRVFDNGFQGDAHGFGYADEDEREASDGAASYYDFSPVDGVRYIVLDTVSYGGQFPLSSSGNVSHPQFLWLERKLEAAQERGELIMVFAHHGIGSLVSPVPHENAPPCRDPATGEDQQHIVGPGCDRDPRDSRKPGEPSPHQGEDLVELMHRFPNAIALIAGHSHDNNIIPRPREDGEGGFWEIKSPAIVDWPAQHRLIELMDNRDGTLSIFTTVLDDASPPRSPTPNDDAGPGARGAPRFEFDRAAVDAFTPEELASVGRTLSYNDPQVGPEGWNDTPPQGTEIDRNTELVIGDPREPAPTRPSRPPTRPPDREPDRDRLVEQPVADVQPDTDPAPAAAVDRRGALPFTGLSILLLLLVAVALLAAGRLARHLSQQGPEREI